MPLPQAVRDLLARTSRWVRIAVVVGLFAVVGMSLATYATVHHTAKPEFCRTCHIMEPYYQSWLDSSHRDVGCIECHYEPGVLETVEGKFKALSQLAKYVTRTQGTKPWAEVSDQSCMRDGCHSVRMLEGRIQFGNVAFDHRHHLLESRRGRRLRCVTCHSQIVQGEHVTVTESVCYMCHFMPGADGMRPERLGDCLMCHGPPSGPVMVAGREFDHGEYVSRGVACQECHNPVVHGDGQVRPERCHSCHAEVGHIERFGETEFLHEAHVTNHKVECYECHDEIDHGRLQHAPLGPAAGEGCGSCHESSHGSVSLMYAGTGGAGVSDAPSRMFETGVACEACHTGRSGGDAPGVRAYVGGAARVKAAGNVDCIHCHGTGFDGMLRGWQTVVGGELERLGTLLDEVEAGLPADAGGEVRALLDEARHNVDLVAVDGSRGAHNVDYALDVLGAGAERIDRARALLDPGAAPRATVGLPPRSEHGCATCHLGVETRDPLPVDGRSFSHAAHLARDLDCAACHGADPHGRPTPTRQDCSACHHAERPEIDVWECADCHDAQAGLFYGELDGFDEMPGSKADFDCTQCHGEPPEVGPPAMGVCALCHDADSLPEERADYTAALDELRAEVEAALAEAGADADPEAAAAARAAIDLIERDGSGGVHNSDFAIYLLEESLERLAP